MKNFLISIILLLSTTVSAQVFSFSDVAPTGQTLFYKIQDDKKHVTIVFPEYNEDQNTCYYGYEEPSGNLTIPEIVTFDGRTYIVENIGSAAFSKCEKLQSVTIPNTIRAIGQYAFAECYGMNTLTIGKGVKLIDDNALYDCNFSLKKTNFTGSIEDWCKIDLRTNPAAYSENLYINDVLLTEVIIPSTIEEIKPYTFHDNKHITSVVIPNTVKRIGSWAFRGCSSLKSISIPDGVKHIEAHTFAFCDNLVSVRLSSNVTSIGQAAFANCTKLRSVKLPNTLDSIGEFAFQNCESLPEIDIPPTVTYIGLKAFDKVSEIAYRGVSEGRPWGAINCRIPTDYNHRLATSRDAIEKEIDKNNDGIIGIYQDISGKLEVAVIKHKDSYHILYVGGRENRWWETGDLQGFLYPSAATGLFRGRWIMNDFSIDDNCFMLFTGATMEFNTNMGKEIFLKMYPNGSSSANTNPSSWSGTGWAIGNGYIITNNHVADEARIITIKGVKGDMNTGYTAEVVATDKVNDIAILKITDSRFGGFGAIPYSVSARMADVGEDVFVLGYPLTQALGNEIKLTNGIISSRTGYQGDVSTYQMSAPVQPGNSGGPMFDSKGNVIGIVVAGVPGAENVGYAIKTSYLKILIESAGLNIKFPTNNTVSTLSLSEKVKRVKGFVFYIECSK